MGRNCADCGVWCVKSEFSTNQWRKGSSRCCSCVNGSGSQRVSYQCQECYRAFDSQNQLNMHMQTHRPRNIACPVCGDTNFRSGANAVQHVESGYCRGCLGKDNARNAIYGFARQQQGMQRFMSDLPMLQNGHYNNNNNNAVPEFPYHCPDCEKSFRQLSQLLQHQDNKHNQMRMIGY